MSDRIYLGDGVDAELCPDRQTVRLSTQRDHGVDEIFLEPDMLQRLIEFAISRGWRLRT